MNFFKGRGLKEISYERLRNMRFSPGDVFWVKRGGDPVKLISVGSVLDDKVIAKFEERKIPLLINNFCRNENLAQAEGLFEDLKKAESERKKVAARENILNWFKGIYWKGSADGNLIDLIVIGDRCFYDFDEKISKKMRNNCLLLYKRSSLLSILGVILSLTFGHIDYVFLKDFYHIIYLLDFHFYDSNFSIHMQEALNLERGKTGEGLRFLSKHKGEREEFESHIKKSFDKVFKELKGLFTNKELINLILIHHEKMDGSGIPKKLSEDEMSDLEIIVVLLSHLSPYNDIRYMKNDGKRYLKKAIALASRSRGKFLSKKTGLLLKSVMG